MGSPMACMYLLGNPDHYTNFNFVPFYWQSFVREARKPWEQTPSQVLKTNIAQGENANKPNSNTIALEQEVNEHPEKIDII